ncbi:MAG TPA: hypothetical protein PLX08_09255 [Bacteroidales bacterium]|jgi:amino acid transporter|nr:hypothetical protein [Bacteroidales bacterium]
MVNKMLPYKFKTPGYSLIIAGFVLTYLYFVVNIRIEIPVLAIVSSFTETKFFTVYKTNIADELIILLLIAGFCMVVFSNEKNETDQIKRTRIKSLLMTIRTEIFLLLFFTLFIYGGGFMVFIVINIVLPFIIYLIVFNILKYKELKQRGL